MKAILGVCKHSPYQILDYIKQWRATLPPEKQEKLQIQFLGIEHRVKETAKVLLIPHLDVVKSHMNELRDSNAVVIVFDSPVILAQSKIPLADTVTVDNLRWTFHELTYSIFIEKLRLALNGHLSAECTMDFSLHMNLINSVQGSLTQMLLNMTNRSRVVEKRREITRAYVSWLLSDKNVDDLINTLTKLGMDEETLQIVVNWFHSKHGAQAKKICAVIAQKQKLKKPISYEKLCAGTTVQPFDLKYLMRYARVSIVTQVDKTSSEIYKSRKNSGEQLTPEEQEMQDFQEAMLANDELEFGAIEDISC